MKHLQPKQLSTTILLAFLISFSGTAQTIDSDQAKDEFKITEQWINTVKGSFTGMQGSLNFDATDLENASFDVCIDASTVETGIDKRDEHLRSEDFFAVSEYPEICFTSTSIAKTESGFSTTGTLKMHGVEKEKTIPFIKNGNTLEGTFTLNRLEFNVGKNIGSFTADEDVEVTITSVMNQPN